MLLKWIQDVLINSKISEKWRRNRLGGIAPQGSVLELLLLLIYVDETPDIIESSVRIVADDTQLWRLIQSMKGEQILQKDLDKTGWKTGPIGPTCKWLLKFTTSKR